MDGPQCRNNYLSNEADYLENKSDYEADQAALDDLYATTLELMTSSSTRLVDNTEFLSWAT